MAARDETYRNQRLLDIVFAVSCLVMLASILWMFWKDYFREFKTVQRKGFDVEVALLKQQADTLKERAQDDVAKAREQVESQLQSFGLQVPAGTSEDQFPQAAKKLVQDQLRIKTNPALIKKSDDLSAMKAERDSLVSQQQQLLQQGAVTSAIEAKEKQIRAMNEKLDVLEIEVQRLKAEATAEEKEAAGRLTELTLAVDELDRLSRERSRLLRTVEQKEIGTGAQIRALPVLDAFASPYRIRQTIPEGLLIDYNFRQVQRNDRCMTCHMFSDRQGFDKASLASLPADKQLSLSEFNVYCNHPRMDLFVGSNSPHSAEKFGCTICHSGQGGAATFNFAYHFPDTGKTNGKDVETYSEMKTRWQKEHDWHADLHPDYMWDFPMLPSRFIESSCLKCHHQVLDLMRTDGKEEAPKLMRGYRLVRELGCFGCHEISGYKGGRSIGPDLRLEPYPALDELTPLERSRMTSDPNDPVGNMRKVGPNLRRIVEKTNPAWTVNWIRSPRSFRPETKMPHFFGLTNNTPGQLSDSQPDAPSQLPEHMAGFPDAEIQTMTYYLFQSSEEFLGRVRELHKLPAADWARWQETRKIYQKMDEFRRENPQTIPHLNHPDMPRDTQPAQLIKLTAENEKLRQQLSKDQLTMILNYFQDQERLRKFTPLLETLPEPAELAAGDAKAGELVFQKHGCVACHFSPAIPPVYGNTNQMLSDAEFGPPLIGLKEKLGAGTNKEASAKKWLYYWLSDPNSYHPRTFMPNPQLKPKERADLVAWLLTDKGNVPPPAEWKDVKVGDGDVKGLARTYLEKALPKVQVDDALEKGIANVSSLRVDADERLLAINQPPGAPYAKLSHDDRLKLYVGKKSVARYGCYACHDIPGFEYAKPIGTPLNEWGKKDSEKLAFENIHDYLTKYHPHYDEFYKDAIDAHRRDGFLYQKLREPRSFDYEKLRDRPWDDRLKMPKFKFSRVRPNKDEPPEAFAERAARDETEALESVMTFVLGLVADPIPLKFVNNPQPDRANEVKGLRIIEKFNCNSCHVFKPGSYDFNFDDETRRDLVRFHDIKKSEMERDFPYPEHSAWFSQIKQPDGRLVARGLPFILSPGSIFEEERLPVELWYALKFKDANGITRDFPAGLNQIGVPLNDPTANYVHPYGGQFSEALVRILARLENKSTKDDRKFLMGSVPPPLIREGQKVQPQWLYEFLRNPISIRPAVRRNLVMPRFNMTSEEAEALVDYFVSVDRLQNPALGLEAFGQRPPQRNPEYQQQARAAYHGRLEEVMGAAPGFDPNAHDYFQYGWSVLRDNNMCFKCHNLGKLETAGKDEEKGPDLSLTADRLRPEFVERWIGFPVRLVPYTLMPQYFENAGPDYHGYQMDLKKPAVRQAIELTPLIGPPHWPQPPLPLGVGPYNQVQMQYALTQAEKIRAVRDALMSWGYLVDPPPAARAVGPRKDPP